MGKKVKETKNNPNGGPGQYDPDCAVSAIKSRPKSAFMAKEKRPELFKP